MNSPSTALNVPEVEIFRRQTRTTSTVVHLNLADITHDESLIQPHPGGNCLNWVLGHLICIYDNVLRLLDADSLDQRQALKRYDRGSAAITGPMDAVNISELIRLWDESVDRIDAAAAKLTTARLDEPVPDSPSRNPKETVRSLLSTIAFHQAYHAGQLGILRRMAGKPGAIA
jgi:hypothetical protein